MASAQLNVRVGDLDGNVAKILDAYDRASADGADVVVYGELTVTGYPPEDLLLKPRFIADAAAALARIAAHTDDAVAVVGFPERVDGQLHNAAAICAAGEVQAIYRKHLLPNYSVFDEERYFEPGRDVGPLVEIAGVRCGVSICEDIWSAAGPMPAQATAGAELAINVNGSPYRRGKQAAREAVVAARVEEAGIPMVYVNQVGGQDELVFDGGSVVMWPDGRVVARSVQFAEALDVVDLEFDDAAPPSSAEVVALSSSSRAAGTVAASVAEVLDPIGEVWQALVLATRDYVEKNGFSEVVIGMSGGVDSSLVAAVAVDAVGPDRVYGVSMPSRFSSEGSKDDARAQAENMGFDFRTIAIEPAHSSLLEMLAPSFGELAPDTTEENLQSRIRGVLLMALSNKFNWLVLTTGNKSETSVGYSTLYGDTAGGYAVIKDCPKLLVYELCRWRNAQTSQPWIPIESITKPPSAELRPDQRDDQSLPDYDELDPLLEAYVEGDRTADDLIEDGFDPDLVRRITRLVDIAEYKRRQSPPGPRVSRKAFGKDRRLPITNGYR